MATVDPEMGTEDGPLCQRHAGDVRMHLRTLHSDQLAPDQVLGAYACPECGAERRLPIGPSIDGNRSLGGLAPGAA
jgi:hypothetical protein